MVKTCKVGWQSISKFFKVVHSGLCRSGCLKILPWTTDFPPLWKQNFANKSRSLQTAFVEKNSSHAWRITSSREWIKYYDTVNQGLILADKISFDLICSFCGFRVEIACTRGLSSNFFERRDFFHFNQVIGSCVTLIRFLFLRMHIQIPFRYLVAEKFSQTHKQALLVCIISSLSLWRIDLH